MRNLVSLVPFGIGVLNLKHISHYNKPFEEILGITH